MQVTVCGVCIQVKTAEEKVALELELRPEYVVVPSPEEMIEQNRHKLFLLRPAS